MEIHDHYVRSPDRPSARPFVRPSVGSSVRPPNRSSDRSSARPFVCPFVGSSDRPSVRPTVRPSVRPSVHPSVRPTARPTVRPCDHPSVRSPDRLEGWWQIAAVYTAHLFAVWHFRVLGIHVEVRDIANRVFPQDLEGVFIHNDARTIKRVGLGSGALVVL